MTLMTMPQSSPDKFPPTLLVVGIKVRNQGQIKKVAARDALLNLGDYVMLDVDRELTYGVVHTESQILPFIPPMRVMQTILRKATEEDRHTVERYERLAEEGHAFCLDRVAALGLPLKLVEVYCSLVRHEMRVLYTAPERVDFRQLVRELARRFGGRIEMQQIGEREKAKWLGGVDSCGQVLCCAGFMTEFNPVTVKHARAQGLPMDESRLNGVCGRLKCCLMFELEGRPTVGSSVLSTPVLINPTRRS